MKKRIKFFALIMIILFPVIIYLACEPAEETTIGVTPLPTPDCNAVAMPDLEEFEYCVEPAQYVDLINVLLDAIDIPLETLNLDTMMSGDDFSWICDVKINDNPVIDIVNNCALDNLITELSLYLQGYSSKTTLTTSLNDMIAVVMSEDNLTLMADILYSATEILLEEELDCVGQWASDALAFAGCYLQNEALIKVAISTLLSSIDTRENLAIMIQEAISMLASSFTLDDATILLDTAEEEVTTFILTLGNSLAGEELKLIGYLRTTLERGKPLRSELIESVDEIYAIVIEEITPAVVELIGNLLDALPQQAKDTIAPILTPQTLRAMLVPMASTVGIDCLEAVCIP